MVRLFSSVDIFITNSGSASYWSLFMPENSHLIVTPICSRVKQTTTTDNMTNLNPEESRKLCHEPSMSSLRFHHSLPHVQVVGLTPEYVKASHFESATDVLGQVEVDIEKVYGIIYKLLESRFL